MQAELSCPVFLRPDYEPPVQIGPLGGVSIEPLGDAFREELFSQCPLIRPRNQMELFHEPYSHRLFIEIPLTSNPDCVTEDEWQPFFETIILSRIVKPHRLPHQPPWFKTFYDDDGNLTHRSRFRITSLAVAHTQGSAIERNTITDVDADRVNRLWPSFHEMMDPAHRQRWVRIVRAVRFFEFAQSAFYLEQQTPLVHAALESLICTSSNQNRAQVLQRLIAITGISDPEAGEIYDLCCDFKHEAQALQQFPLSPTGTLDPTDRARRDAAAKLQVSVRQILLRAFDDRSFAAIIADVNQLRNSYRVLDRNGGVVP